MSKHTPGPWHQGRNGDNCGEGYAICGGLMAIAKVYGLGYPIGQGNHPESDANARLIAAAPDACAELSETLDILRTIVDSGAIKTATNIPETQKTAILSELHERIASTRALLARIDNDNK